MEDAKKSFLDSVIWVTFLSLAIFTPLLFTNINTELYEVPKMFFIYVAAGLLLTLTGLKFIKEKKVLWPKNASVAVFIGFILVQIFSTIFSIDKFTSIYGYPTRLNGGLLSQIAYLIIFVSALINLNRKQSLKLLITSTLTAFIVALIGIASHFGYDLSCYLLTGNVNSSCWQAEFNPTLRIFSTLGQPNWLATYMVLTIPIALALLFNSKATSQKILLTAITVSLVIALLLTNSRSGLAGLVSLIILFTALSGKRLLKKNRKLLAVIFVIFIVTTAIFGSTLLGRVQEVLKRQTNVAGGTETGYIRLIVWQGALQAFQKRPLLGYGPETFAYSYSQFRPSDHNKTTEWNFFYNKAHNEFLNYLTNTGVLGAFFFVLLQLALIREIVKSTKTNSDLNSLLSNGAISAIVAYQAAVFFGFSTAVSQLILFLTAGCILADEKSLKEIPLNFNKTFQMLTSFVFFLFGAWIITFVLRAYFADIFYNQSLKLTSSESIKAAFNAIDTFPSSNPFYLSDFAQNSAQYSASVEDKETQKLFELNANNLAVRAEHAAPNNFITVRRLVNTYILLQGINPKYESQLSSLEEKLLTLAPTDPQTYLTSAKVEISKGNKEEAIKYIQKALELKPNYVEAQELKVEFVN